MIDEYLNEFFIRERLANTRRNAALYLALRELESRRARPWRDAIHRCSQAISSLQLSRRTERMAVRGGAAGVHIGSVSRSSNR